MDNNTATKLKQLFGACMGEVLGTIMLMFFGCLTTFNAATGEPASLTKVALGWGFIITVIVVCFSHISGGQTNPCVSLCFYLLGKQNRIQAFFFIISQLTGCTVGMLLLKISVPFDLKVKDKNNVTIHSHGLCNTFIVEPTGLWQAFFMEFMATALLIFAVCGTSDPRKEHLIDSTPLKFGFLISLLVFTVAPMTGASMNPARSFAPALTNNMWREQWLYWIAPLSGTIFATYTYKYLFSSSSMFYKESEVKQLTRDVLKPRSSIKFVPRSSGMFENSKSVEIHH